MGKHSQSDSPERGSGAPSEAREGAREECARSRSILRAAALRFAQDGFARADVGAIATGAGCAKGTIYLYFKSKEDLFRAAVDAAMADLVAATEAPPDLDPVEQIAFSVRGFLAYFDSQPHVVELLIQERAVFRDRETPTYFEYRDASRARGLRLLQALEASGRLRATTPERALDLIATLLYGTIFTHHFARRRSSLAEQADDLLAALFHGLIAPGEAGHGEAKQIGG